MINSKCSGMTYLLRIIAWGTTLSVSLGGLYGVSTKLPGPVRDLINRYSREITLLEIGKKECPYFPSLVQYNAQCIALCMGGADSTLVTKASQRHNGIILGPKTVTHDMIHTLGACEHFDIVIVHNLQNTISEFMPFVSAFLRLGDHIFIEASTAEQCRVCKNFGMVGYKHSHGTTLFYLHKRKTTLEKARFTQKIHSSEPKPVYRVTSDFHTKFFSKGPLFKQIPWIHGINMVSFVMFSGIYPTDSIVRQGISGLKNRYAHHNDLVIGNIIMRGDQLIPIDFGDERRSTSSVSCIAAALRAFHSGNGRLKDPHKWINDYYKYV
ncbi:hypothetical protein H0W26_04675 [Candidatus Dependentiae bacterium]|nr:hypothetical protein [Candidatus Dependentiae bacterium]